MCSNVRRILTFSINALLLLAAVAPAQQNNASAAAPQTGSPAPASQANTPGQGRWQQQHRVNAFAQALNLSDEQKRQFTEIQKEAGKAVWAARHEDSLTEEKMQQKIKQIHSEQRQKVLALLTPDQQQALKKWTDEHKLKPEAGNTQSGSATAVQDKSSKDDDFFAGMTQDPEPAAQGQRPAPKSPKN